MDQKGGFFPCVFVQEWMREGGVNEDLLRSIGGLDCAIHGLEGIHGRNAAYCTSMEDVLSTPPVGRDAAAFGDVICSVFMTWDISEGGGRCCRANIYGVASHHFPILLFLSFFLQQILSNEISIPNLTYTVQLLPTNTTPLPNTQYA